jgi:gliding motility-associatede transport system auxiliary component
MARASVSRRARPSALRHWALLLVSLAGLGGSLFMAQLILSHHNWRLDLTPEKRFTLSDHSRQILKGLDRDVQIIAFLRSDDERNPEIEDLLNRVSNGSPHVQTAVVDVNRNPAVAREYGVGNYASVVVASEGRRKEFPNPREDLLMEAILQVTRPTRKVVYFLTGHGEQDVNNTDRHAGYSAVRTLLRGEFYEVLPLSLLGETGVPKDANVVVIAAPRKDLLTSELLKLSEYVERGGGLLVMMDPQSSPSLGAFLERYGVRFTGDVVVDPENRLFAGDYLTMTVPGLSEAHPVSAALKAPPLFSQARAVEFPAAAPRGVKGIEFLHTAPSSWRTPDLNVLRTGVATFASGRDQPGPVPVGVSVLVSNSVDGKPGRTARFIILGDSDFADNFFIEYLGDKDLLVNSIDWLAGEEELVGQRTPLRQPGVNQFFVSARQGRLAFILGTIVEPALFLLVGAVVILRRRWAG